MRIDWRRLLPASDRLSPILVLELRQGLRSQIFTGSFLALQLLLFLFGLFALLGEDIRRDASISSAVCWTMIGIPLLVLIPASAGRALEKERTARTLELLQLTSLSATRIVVGKWTSIVVQTVLLLVSAVPYLMLRYFVGGIDIWNELRIVAILLLASALLTGISLGFSALGTTRWLKWGFVAAMLWALAEPVARLLRYPHRASARSGELLTLLILDGLLLMLLMLELAAHRIAPPAENHATRFRLVALAAMVVAVPFLDAHRSSRSLATITALVFALPVVVASLCETTRPIRSLYAPFTRRMPLLRLALRPLCPGWPGGHAFTLLILAGTLCLPGFLRDPEDTYHIWLALVATLLFPLLVTKTLLRRMRKAAVAYLLVLLASSLPVFVWFFSQLIDQEWIGEATMALGGFFPVSALVFELADDYPLGVADMARSTLRATTAVSLLATTYLAGVEWRRLLRIGNAQSARRRTPMPRHPTPAATAPAAGAPAAREVSA